MYYINEVTKGCELGRLYDVIQRKAKANVTTTPKGCLTCMVNEAIQNLESLVSRMFRRRADHNNSIIRSLFLSRYKKS